MSPTERRQTAAWTFLVAATLMSFWAAAHLGTQMGAIAAIMTIAAGKVIVVLRRFMDFNRLALPLKLYFYAWSIGCAALILGVAAIDGAGASINHPDSVENPHPINLSAEKGSRVLVHALDGQR